MQTEVKMKELVFIPRPGYIAGAELSPSSVHKIHNTMSSQLSKMPAIGADKKTKMGGFR